MNNILEQHLKSLKDALQRVKDGQPARQVVTPARPVKVNMQDRYALEDARAL